MKGSFFFYDLETSGFSPSKARVMQFAGQRTDLKLKPIGEPVNMLIKMAPDVLPDPDAVMLTGITPQMTLQDGLTEAEFLELFWREVIQPDTCFLGFNSIRFDDEFMRFLHYRNFYDAYEWQWKDGCSRWDLLDVVRMTRALRPEGVQWPVDADGRPTNRLETLTKANKLSHDNAHDALADVQATISVAQLIRDKQPDLFDYLYAGRGKKAVEKLVIGPQPFVYTTGRYSGEWLNTSAAIQLAAHPQSGASLVYNLRFDPTPFLDMSPEQLAATWVYKKDRDPADLQLPVKTLKYNRAPAVAPLGVMKDPAVQARLGLTIKEVEANLGRLRAGRAGFAKNVLAALQLMDAARERDRQAQAQAGPQPAPGRSGRSQPSPDDVDTQLYDGFLADHDRAQLAAARAATPDQLPEAAAQIKDKRLQKLLPLYKARNFPQSLTHEERRTWEKHRYQQLMAGGKNSRLAGYMGRLQELAAAKPTDNQRFLLEELQLYAESIMPEPEEDLQTEML